MKYQECHSFKFKTKAILSALAISFALNSYADDRGRYSDDDRNFERESFRQAATMVLKNGNIITMSDERKVAKAVAIKNNVIIYVGSNDEVNRYVGKNTQVVDLKGKTVLPGFIDTHIHPVGGSERLGLCSMNGESLTITEIIARAKDCLAKDTGGSTDWFKVVGVNPAGLEATKTDLDKISSTRPVLLQGVDFHTSWTNTLGLKLAGITAATPDPEGGIIKRDASGEPTGFLNDNAQYIVTAVIPPLTADQKLKKAEQALDMITSKGITTFQDAAASSEVMDVYEAAQMDNHLNARVRGDVLPPSIDDNEAIYAGIIALRDRFKNNPLIKVDAVKIFSDGVIEYPTQTAAMIKPYRDVNGNITNNYGGRYFDQAVMNKFIARIDKENFRINVHYIGDFTTHAMLDSFEYARKVNGFKDNRHQISHLEIIDPADIPRFRKLNVYANMQLFWAMPNVYSIDALQPFIDPSEFKYIYPAASLKAAGATIIGGSDWPVDVGPEDNLMPNNPMTGIYVGVTRNNPIPTETYYNQSLTPEQRVSRNIMIEAYTINAAKGLKMEKQVGSIEVGKFADLVFFDADITKMPIRKVWDLTVSKTMFNGKFVYERPVL